jgi:hypothetical protein
MFRSHLSEKSREDKKVNYTYNYYSHQPIKEGIEIKSKLRTFILS